MEKIISEELHNFYMNSRKKYKMHIKENKRLHDGEQERRIIQASENNPFQALMIRQPWFPRDIPMQTWENYFSTMLNKHKIVLRQRKTTPSLSSTLSRRAKLQILSPVPRITKLQAQTVSTTSI
jgi:hypothetical protein